MSLGTGHPGKPPAVTLGVAHRILPHPGASKGGYCGTVPAQQDQDLKALLGPGCQVTAAHPSTALSGGADPCQQHAGP